jgi:hypothetical protein
VRPDEDVRGRPRRSVGWIKFLFDRKARSKSANFLTTKRPSTLLAKWQCGLMAWGMARWPHGQVPSWPGALMARWPHGQVASWPWSHGQTAYGDRRLMARRPHGQTASWGGGVEKILIFLLLMARRPHDQVSNGQTAIMATSL